MINRIILLTTVVAAIPAPAYADAFPYVVTDLGTLGNASLQSGALAINNQGQVVGWAADPATGCFANAFFWAGNGAPMQDLGTFDGQLTSTSTAITVSNNGWVVGRSSNGNTTIAFLWTGGAIKNIGTLGGAAAFAFGVNSAGTVVGGSLTASGSLHGFIYNNGIMTDTGSLVGEAISDSGDIAAYLPGGIGVMSTYLVAASGQSQNVGSLGGIDTQPSAINDTGQIVGFSTTPQATHAFLYSAGTMTDLGVLVGAVQSDAFGINDAGTVVGESAWASGTAHAFIYSRDGPMEDLNALIPPDSGWILESANGTNDNGQIVGIGISPSGNEHAFLLNPVAEPSSIAMLAAAACCLLIFGRYRRRRFK